MPTCCAKPSTVWWARTRRHGDPEREHAAAAVRPGYGRAPAEAIRLFLTELAEEHGSVHGYVRNLGMDPRDLTATLRRHYLAD